MNRRDKVLTGVTICMLGVATWSVIRNFHTPQPIDGPPSASQPPAVSARLASADARLDSLTFDVKPTPDDAPVLAQLVSAEAGDQLAKQSLPGNAAAVADAVRLQLTALWSHDAREWFQLLGAAGYTFDTSEPELASWNDTARFLGDTGINPAQVEVRTIYLRGVRVVPEETLDEGFSRLEFQPKQDVSPILRNPVQARVTMIEVRFPMQFRSPETTDLIPGLVGLRYVLVPGSNDWIPWSIVMLHSGTENRAIYSLPF